MSYPQDLYKVDVTIPSTGTLTNNPIKPGRYQMEGIIFPANVQGITSLSIEQNDGAGNYDKTLQDKSGSDFAIGAVADSIVPVPGDKDILEMLDDFKLEANAQPTSALTVTVVCIPKG